MIKKLDKPLALFMLILSIAIVFAFMPQQADARKGNRGGGKAHSSVNRGHNKNTNRNRNTNKNVNRNTNVNRNKNVNRNTNVNVNNNRRRNVNVDIDVDHRHGRNYHPIGTAVAVGAAVAVTAAVVGSIINTLPSGCTTVIQNGISYSQCGNVWYEPQYAGNNVTYVVVNTPY